MPSQSNTLSTETKATTMPNGTASPSKSHFDSIPDCIEAYGRGEFLIVLDAASRENEGDLIIRASHLTPAKTAFMIRHTSGYLCAPLSRTRAEHLGLPPMVPAVANADPHITAYTITVDAQPASQCALDVADPAEAHPDTGGAVTTGISAHDRSVAARVLADPRAREADLRKPGHLIPLLVRDGGVRVRRGHTEATWEFGRLAGVEPNVGVIGELVIDGEEVVGKPEYTGAAMMRERDCLEFGRRWGIKCCTIKQLIEHVQEVEGS